LPMLGTQSHSFLLLPDAWQHLDFAYWSINGDFWAGGRNFSRMEAGWADEWYGLLKADYKSIRHPSMLEDMELSVAAFDPPSAPAPPYVPGLDHHNDRAECWSACQGQNPGYAPPDPTGLCPDFCGHEGACCRLGSPHDVANPSCGHGTTGCDGFHCCVRSLS